MLIRCAAVAALLSSASAAAQPGVVFRADPDNGFFTPFDSSTSEDVRYADSGWLSSFTTDTYILDSISMNMASFGGTFEGSFDLVFSFHDGSPSGLVFGPGTELFSTVVTGVTLPQANSGLAEFFEVPIALPNIETTGGFNNIGWSVGVRNVNYDGSFGFMVSSASAQTAGFYTNNASTFDGTSWSLFSFGADVANYSVVVTGSIPAPASFGVLAGAGLLAGRRRR